jgi:hypothetical protein
MFAGDHRHHRGAGKSEIEIDENLQPYPSSVSTDPVIPFSGTLFFIIMIWCSTRAMTMASLHLLSTTPLQPRGGG